MPDDSLNLLGRWQLPERVGGLGTTDSSALDRSALRVCASFQPRFGDAHDRMSGVECVD